MVLTDTDRELIAVIQQGLPLVSRPYAAVGAQLGLPGPNLLGIAAWRARLLAGP